VPIPMLVKRFYKLHQAVLNKAVYKMLSSTEKAFSSCLETCTVLTSIDSRKRNVKGRKTSLKIVASKFFAHFYSWFSMVEDGARPQMTNRGTNIIHF
jgi:hypothetical protein